MNETVITRPRARHTVGGVIRSEWIKLTSLRSIRFTLFLTFLAGVGIMGLGAMVMSDLMRGSLMTTEDHVNYLLQTLQPPIMFMGLLFGVLGVFAMSSEYSSGMILSTLAATPRRGRVWGAKLLVSFLISLGTAVATLAVGQGIALLFMPGARVALTEPQYLTAWAGSLLFLVAMTLLAYGVAGILRSTAGGIAVVTALTFVLPIAFSFAALAGKEWVNWIMDRLPLILGNSLSAGAFEPPADVVIDVVPWGEAAAWIGLWALVFIIPAAILFMRRDAK